jgi:hypothetical protein
MEDNIEPFILMKDLFNAIERHNTINIDNFNLYQVYGRIIRSIRGKNDDVKDLLLEDIKMLANISDLSKKSRRGILLALYDSLLSFANVNNATSKCVVVILLYHHYYCYYYHFIIIFIRLSK